MCWTDVQISKQQFVQSVYSNLGNGSTIFFPADLRRRRLVLFNFKNPGIAAASPVWVTLYRGSAAVVSNTLVAFDSSQPFSFDADTFGTVVTEPLTMVIDDSDGRSVWSVVEVVLVDPQGYGDPNQSTPRG